MKSLPNAQKHLGYEALCRVAFILSPKMNSLPWSFLSDDYQQNIAITTAAFCSFKICSLFRNSKNIIQHSQLSLYQVMLKHLPGHSIF